MEKIANIIETMIAEAEKAKKENEGGMESYVNTLEDSDTFFDEAHAIGEYEALTKLKEALKPFLPTEEEEDTEICNGCGKPTKMSDMSDVMTMWICNTCEEGMEDE